jgi:hypothetical protein
MIFKHICDDQTEQNVDVKSHDFSWYISDDPEVKATVSWKNYKETVPLIEMWTNPCLGGTVFYRQTHIWPFVDQLSHID